MQNLTPAMRQYVDIKKKHSDCILFFRLGDFYEVFFDDAKLCSKLLDLVLTSKNKNKPNPIPMAWIPYHSSEKYIKKLINYWYKVAIAEQMTNPVPGKIVEREVVSIITPGTYLSDDNKWFSYIVALYSQTYKDWTNYHISWWDFSIGEYTTKSFHTVEEMQKFVCQLNPSEIIFDINFLEKGEIQNNLKNSLNSLISLYDIPFNPEEYILQQTRIQTLSSFGTALEEWRLNAFALLINYIKNTQKSDLYNIVKVSFHQTDKKVLLDDITIKNLEIFSSSYESNEKYSLAGVINTSKTAGWSRLLYHILANPINDIDELRVRLSHIEYYQNNIELTEEIHKILSYMSDIPRLLTRIIYKKTLPTLFVKIRFVLWLFFKDINNNLIFEMERIGLHIDDKNNVYDIFALLNNLLKDDDEVNDTIDFIKDGYNNNIDNLRSIAYHSDDLLIQYQQDLVNLTGISNIKLKFIMNQWYFLEVTNKDIEKFEAKLYSIKNELDLEEKEKYTIERRNTLIGSQRYTSAYLEIIQNKVLSAKEELISAEFKLLAEIKEKLTDIMISFNNFYHKISWLDIYTSHALLARDNNFIKPDLKKESNINIKLWRHPVIERYLDNNQHFIPNNLNIWDNTSFLHIITGPNMGGKSTFLRQNALIILMAHCGLFVPANEAKIGLVDWIFARVGSGDVIAKNQSTFMTEMIEVSNILNNATKNSFIIFDELGRWTSTYDWLALTKAILEYVAKEIKAKTLIATHYHELIKLEWNLNWVKNYSVWVYETEKEVIFMKKIVEWWASKSYWLDVAKLAGISQSIIDQAKKNLEQLEISKHNSNNQKQQLWLDFEVKVKSDPRFEKIKQIIESLNINEITPLQALQILSKIQWEL